MFLGGAYRLEEESAGTVDRPGLGLCLQRRRGQGCIVGIGRGLHALVHGVCLVLNLVALGGAVHDEFDVLLCRQRASGDGVVVANVDGVDHGLLLQVAGR